MEQKPKKPIDDFLGTLKISITDIFKDINTKTKKSVKEFVSGGVDMTTGKSGPTMPLSETARTVNAPKTKQQTPNTVSDNTEPLLADINSSIVSSIESIRTAFTDFTKQLFGYFDKMLDYLSTKPTKPEKPSKPGDAPTSDVNMTLSFDKEGFGMFETFIKSIDEKSLANFKSFVESMKTLASIDLKKIKDLNDSMTKLETVRTKTKISPLQQIATGIGILVLALVAVNFLDFAGMVKLIGFIGLLAIVLMGVKKIDVGASMFYFAAGIGVLTLAMAMMTFIEWESLTKLIVFIGLLGLIFKVSGFDTTKQKDSPLWMFSAGIGILVLALISMVLVDWQSIAKLLVFIGGLSLVLHSFPGTNPGWTMAQFAIGLGVMILAMYAMQLLPWTALLTTLGFLTALGWILKLYNPATTYAMLMVAGGLAAIAGVFFIISKIDMSGEKMLIFGISVVGLSVMMAGLALIAPLMIAGSVAFAAMGVSLIVGALGLATISALTIDNEKIKAFGSAVWDLSVALTLALPMLLIGAVAAVALMPIAAATLLAAGSLKLLSMIDIKPEPIVRFLTGTKLLVDGINEFGLFSLAKAAAKSLLILPVVATLLAAATVLQLISSLDIGDSKIQAFGVLMNTFVTSISTTLMDNIERLKAIEPGLEALSKLINVGSQLASVVQAFASMTYNVYGVKDGKIVLTGVKKITEDDIKMVGTNIGKLIQGLIAPLAIISSDDKVWDFGNGVKVNNPFAGGWFGDSDSGTERLLKIGNAFIPLTEVMKNLSGLDMSNGANASLAVKQLIDVVNQINAVTEINDNFGTAVDAVSTFMETLGDQGKWDAINKNLDAVAKNFKAITTSINSLNVDKAMALERNLKLMANKDSAESLEKVVENLAELIGLMRETVVATQKQAAPQSKAEAVYNEKKEKAEVKIAEVKESNELMAGIMTKVADSIESVNIKLGNKLKVVVVDSTTPNKL